MATAAPASPPREHPDQAPEATDARPWWREHGPFLGVLGLGTVLRVLAMVGFPPALVFSDGPSYLSMLDSWRQLPIRPAGFAWLVLYPVHWFTDSLRAVVAVQHLIGLATAGVLYALLRRWGVGRWVAAVAASPVLLDGMQLVLEHAILSDALFSLMVLTGVAVLAWRRTPTVPLALAAGVLLGASVTVRLVGQPLVLSGILYCLLAGRTWRERVATSAAVTVGFLVPVLGYATWYHSQRDVFALSEFSGRSLYLRTTTWVDCEQLTIPDYQRVLCPADPLGERVEPTWYVWHDDRILPQLEPPPGVTNDQAMHDFAINAIRSQPLDYAKIALRDFVLNFDWVRINRFEFDTAHKWHWTNYVETEPTPGMTQKYLDYGGEVVHPEQPYADTLVIVQRFLYTPGPVLLACLLLGVVTAAGVGRARRSGLRAVTLLMTVTGTGLMLAPALTAEFVWRYSLPALSLLPAAAALGYVALRGRPSDDGTVATPSTD